MREYKWLNLQTVKTYEPEMQRLGVSEIARGPGGFLTAYKYANGIPGRMSEKWHSKRHGFIARHLAQYRLNPTYRRKLALIAWAYMPR